MRYVFRNGLITDVDPQSKSLAGVELTFSKGLVTFTNRSEELKSVKLYDQSDLGNENHDDVGEYSVMPAYQFDLEAGESVSEVIVASHYILRTYTRVPEVTGNSTSLPEALSDALDEFSGNGDVEEAYQLKLECHIEMTVDDQPSYVVVDIASFLLGEPEAATPTTLQDASADVQHHDRQAVS